MTFTLYLVFNEILVKSSLLKTEDEHMLLVFKRGLESDFALLIMEPNKSSSTSSADQLKLLSFLQPKMMHLPHLHSGDTPQVQLGVGGPHFDFKVLWNNWVPSKLG